MKSARSTVFVDRFMTDQTAILIVVLLVVVVVALFVHNGRQKRRFEEERAARKRKLDQIKAEARAKAQSVNDADSDT